MGQCGAVCRSGCGGGRAPCGRPGPGCTGPGRAHPEGEALEEANRAGDKDGADEEDAPDGRLAEEEHPEAEGAPR